MSNTNNMELNKVIHGNCLQVMKTLPENSVDSIVTDPPYELGFMGKSWDKTGIANNKEMWKEALRVLKPGGHLLSFGGTRTYHRMACAIEDAGFEVRDMISWIYGSGFPKSLNIGKAIDKMEGTEYPKNTLVSENGSMSGGNYTRNTIDIQSELGKEWSGWGTALKPACEPCVLARKPLSEKTVAENVLKWGTGGINIDGSRVGTTGARNNGNSKGTEGSNSIGVYGKAIKQDYNMGRFPANIIHDGSDEVLEVFPNSKATNRYNWAEVKDDRIAYGGKIGDFRPRNEFGDDGSATRFFYCAKTSKSERNKGCEELEDKEWIDDGAAIPERENRPFLPSKNNHPTVKPQALMKYLIKLITPKGGKVLDPFAGSGSTLVAAKDLGFNYIGIELTEEYIPIIEARLK